MSDAARVQIVADLVAQLNDVPFQLPLELSSTPLRSAAPSQRPAESKTPAAAAASGGGVTDRPPLVPDSAHHAHTAAHKKKAKRKVVAIADAAEPPVALPTKPVVAAPPAAKPAKPPVRARTDRCR